MNASDPLAIRRYVESIHSSTLPDHQKGLVNYGGHVIGQIPAVVRSSRDLSTPIAVIRDDRLSHNILLAALWARELDIALAPHVKTTMAPQIIARQLAAGAWAVTVASIAQAGVVVALGARRVIVANELADPDDLRQVVRWQADYPELELFVYIDSVAGTDLLEREFLAAGGSIPLRVLLEVGVHGGRGGVRTIQEAVSVAARARRSPVLKVCGCAGFEGILAGDRGPDNLTQVEKFLEFVLDVAAAMRDSNDDAAPWVVSAGGSVFPDIAARVLSSRAKYSFDRLVVIRSGGYVTSDDGYLGVQAPSLLGQRLQEALHIRARVLSVPEPGLAILAAGKRDFGTDIRMPRPLRLLVDEQWHPLPDHAIVSVNDQHAYVRAIPEGGDLDGRLTVGALVELGISHPCTTFDRWRYLALINADDELIDIYPTQF